MIWTIPNILTIVRIVAAPGVAMVFLVFERPTADWIAFGLFVGAALTDFLDGWLARKLGQISEIGKMLDPIADKAMVIIALAVLLAIYPAESDDDLNAFIVIPAVIIMLREVVISGLREYLGDHKLPTTLLAKWKTTAQMVAIAILLFVIPFIGWAPPKDDPRAIYVVLLTLLSVVGIVLLWLAALFTLISGWDYLRKGLAYIRDREGQ